MPAAIPGEPKLADFDFDPEKYAQAKAEFAARQTEQKLTAKQQEAQQKQFRQQLTSGWEEKVDGAEDKYPDFAQIVGELTPDTPFTAAIFEADNGPDIAYYLGKHPKEAQRIAGLHPMSQIREIGKLEAKLALEPEKPKAPSKAPAPVATLSGTSPAEPKSISDPNLPFKEFLKMRNKQLGRTA